MDIDEVKRFLRKLRKDLRSNHELRSNPDVREAIALAAIATNPRGDSGPGSTSKIIKDFSNYLELFHRHGINDSDKSKILKRLDTFRGDDIENERMARDMVILSMMASERYDAKNKQYYRPWYSFDGAVPNSVGKAFPGFDPQSLIIMSWVGRRKSDNKGKEKVEVVWLNSALRDFVQRRLETRRKSKAWYEDNQEIDDWFRPLADMILTKEDIEFVPRKEAPGIDIGKFFNWLMDPDDSGSRSTFNAFKSSLIEEAPKLLMDAGSYEKLWEKYPDESTQINKSEETVEAFCRLLQPSKDLGHVVCGARALPLKGVKLRKPSHNVRNLDASEKNRSKGNERTFDLYGVWHVCEQERKKKFTSSSLIAVQGILIPVTLRSNLADDLDKSSAQAEGTRIINRNFAHNLGAHAIQHIVGDIRDAAAGDTTSKVVKSAQDQRELARFLTYVGERAEFINMVVLGERLSFIPLPLYMIVDAFVGQRYLMNNLCRTEQENISDDMEPVNLQLLDPDPNLLVSTYGGMLGMHAIFALWENFARNSIKHAPRLSEDLNQVQLKIRVDVEGDTLKCHLWDAAAGPPDEIDVQFLANNEWGQSRMRNDSGEIVEKLGLAEMGLWSGFIRGLDFHFSLGSTQRDDPGHMQHETAPNGSMGLCFELLRGRYVNTLVNDDELKSSAIFTVDSTGKHFGKLAGQWFARTDKIDVRTPFDIIDHVSADTFFQDIDDDVQSYIRLQAAWIRALHRKALDGDMEPVRILIFDNALARDFGAEEWCAREVVGPGITEESGAPPLYTARVLNEDSMAIADVLTGFFAVWDRHGKFRHTFTENETYAGRTLFYESYPASSSSPTEFLIRSLLKNASIGIEAAFGELAVAALTGVHIVDDRFHASERPHAIDSAARAGVICSNPFGRIAGGQPWGNWLKGTTKLPRAKQRDLPIIMESIHVSLHKNREGLPKDMTFENLAETRAGEVPYFYIHTGRGANPLQGAIGKATPISATTLKRLAFSQPSKLMLVQALYQEGMKYNV